MAGRIRTLDFLPEIFRTKTNEQFLRTSLDQLVQEPQMRRVSGYIGRKVGATVQPGDRYVVEPTKSRENYQLEPAVTFLDPATKKVNDVLTFPGLLDTIRVNDGNISKIDRLFNSEFYSWDPFIDYDKFINFSQYYWLPYGPDSVDVASTAVPTTDDFDIIRSSQGYEFSGQRGILPIITLVRGGSYQFNLSQNGANFWIQSAPGVDGLVPGTTFSSRDVFGVINNGEDQGTTIFNVPSADAQQEYFEKESAGTVDLVSDLLFNQINNRYLSDLLINQGGIDGTVELENKTIIFTTRFGNEDGGWVNTTRFDGTSASGTTDNIEGFDAEYNSFDKSSLLTDNNQKYGVWRIEYVYDPGSTDPYIRLVPDRSIDLDYTLTVNSGETYAGTTFFKNENGFYEQFPLITANAEYLYYQDSIDPEMFGVIRIIDASDNNPIYIDDIVGKPNYTAPNGVIFTNGLKVTFRGLTYPESYAGSEFYVEGVGSAIRLMPVENYITPEAYTQSVSELFDVRGFDQGGYDESLNSPVLPDYFTINRSSQDNNAWARSNRWFHKDVIAATAAYNNQVPEYNQTYRANRPIIEFLPDIKLHNFGVNSIGVVNVIDTVETDAFSNIHGSYGYSVDGYNLVNGSRILFVNDLDPDVRRHVYEVSFEDIPGYAEPVLLLTEDSTISIEEGATVLVTNGHLHQGTTFYYENSNWVESQLKGSVNQPPLFDVFDSNGVSFADSLVYPSTTFNGCELFSYARGTGVADPVLKMPLQYRTIENVGDIVFEHDLSNDTITYAKGVENITTSLSEGFVRRYSGYTDYTSLTGWQKAYTDTVSRQIFNFAYNNEPLTLDVLIAEDTPFVPVKIYVDGKYVPRSTYDVLTNSKGKSVITFLNEPDFESNIEVSVLSDDVSKVGYYSIPGNLETNAVNENIKTLTLGSVRNQYSTICQNIPGFSGNITGANNTRDLGNLVPFGTKIVQQSAPLTFASMFMQNDTYDFLDALRWTSVRYEEFKSKLLTTLVNGAIADFNDLNASQALDHVLEILNEGKTENAPFYWSDMLLVGSQYKETVYEVFSTIYTTFNTLYTYDFDKASNTGLLVYLNDKLLVKDKDYTVATDGPRITTLVPLSVGDKIYVREYTATQGNFVPPTPSKLGMYPVYEPEIRIDTTYKKPTKVIQGHDGSITVAFGDIRDEVLLEYETRVYNNIKVGTQYNDLLSKEDVIPSPFRSTEYTYTETNDILSESFLQWVGNNRLDFKSQDYVTADEFSWNYTQCTNRIDGELLLGHWRGIYQYFYNTDAPHMRPWEMLGIYKKPSWWENRYGPAPYTSGNLVLWNDIEAGLIAEPNNERIVEKFKRPGLLEVLPVDSQGKLVSPMQSVVAGYVQNDFQRSWAAGDGAPVEAAWRKSSAYPFAIQRLLALTKPAKYFALFADVDRYRYSEYLDQFVVDGRKRLNTKNIEVYGSNTPKHSYINWVVDYNRTIGLESSQEIADILGSIDIRLVHRLGGFSDKRYLKLFAEKSSPESVNSSLLLPDESYTLMLYKNPVFDELRYSSVIIQRTSDGFSVSGYCTRNPYFEILPSIPNGNYSKVSIGYADVRIAHDFGKKPVRVPYGYVFRSPSTIVDFLISYGKFLESRGLEFKAHEGTAPLSWQQMAVEFLAWEQESWNVGSIINLNPMAERFDITRPGAIVDSIIKPQVENAILNQNNKPISPRDYVVERVDNTFTLKSLNENTFNFVRAKFTSYEHIIVLDNTSVFQDLIYDPATGTRQTRCILKGFKSTDWNGTLDAPGFILNNDNITEWSPNKTYNKGDIVKYKGAYWSASRKIQPTLNFEQDKWIASDYERIQKGLLPNIATKAEQTRNYYDMHTANLESDADLLAFGLTGFRPRQYMANLNLDDITQVNLYKEFIGKKGTIEAASMFANANLSKEIANYDLYENWAILKGEYGATANRVQLDFALTESKHTSNPSTLEITNSVLDQSSASQAVTYNDLYRSSYRVTDKNVFPVNGHLSVDETFPTAGFVKPKDVDFAIFDYEDLGTVITDNLDSIVEGTTFWIARDTIHNWNVYRATQVKVDLIKARDNLNDSTTLTFDAEHDILPGEIVIVKDFDSAVNGGYIVQSVTDTTVQVCQSLLADAAVIDDRIGLALRLSPAHLSQASDIVNLSYLKNVTDGDKVWVDTFGSEWAVLEKTSPFKRYEYPLQDNTLTSYGKSIAQGFSSSTMLAKSSDTTVDVFTKPPSSNYRKTQMLVSYAEQTSGFGDAIAMSKTTTGIIGAPGSNGGMGYAFAVNRNDYTGGAVLGQMLVSPFANPIANFGADVAITDDGKMAFVAAPGLEVVCQYTLINNTTNNITITQEETSATVIIDVSSMLATSASQLIVSIDNEVISSSLYGILAGSLRLFTTVNAGSVIRVMQKMSINRNLTTPTSTILLTELPYAKEVSAIQVKTTTGDVLRPNFDYFFNENTHTLTFATPQTGFFIIESLPVYWKFAGSIGMPIDATGKVFVSGNGNKLVMPAASNGFAGYLHVYDRREEVFTANASTTQIYSLSQPSRITDVYVDNKKLNYSPTGLNNDYNIGPNFVTSEPTYGLYVQFNIDVTPGSIIRVVTTEYLPETVLSGDIGARIRYDYGHDVAMTPDGNIIVASSVSDRTTKTNAGSFDVWSNNPYTYGTVSSTNTTPVLTMGDTISINHVAVALTGNTVEDLANDIIAADIPNVTASVANGIITVKAIKLDNTTSAEALAISPLTGNLFNELAFRTYSHTQTVESLEPVENSNFGHAMDLDGQFLIVSEPHAGGKVYAYDLVNGKPSVFVVGQTMNPELSAASEFGHTVSLYNGTLVVGAPVTGVPSDSVLIEYANYDSQPMWKTIARPVDQVDVRLFNGVNIYDTTTNKVIDYIDYIDPIQGKILGQAKQNLDYIAASDPAAYNVEGTNNYGQKWTADHVGETWWNISTMRFLDYHQDEEQYTARVWGQTFPGSSVDVYQWIESSVSPAEYAEDETLPGTPYSTSHYTISSKLNVDGLFDTLYYFWVKGLTHINGNSNKTLSIAAVAQYIENPKSSGIPYAAFLAPNKIALYNVSDLVNSTCVLHVDFDRKFNDDNIHLEYDLFSAGDETSELSPLLYRKFLDSLCGEDTFGNQVPSVDLGPAVRYGIKIRPRQTMFADKLEALKIYFSRANTILAQYPVAEQKVFDLLYSEEPVPSTTTNQWDVSLETYAELEFQDLNLVTAGTRYLVKMDETQYGQWSIYTVQADKTLLLTRVQNYYTPRYWTLVDWIKPGYDITKQVTHEVETRADLLTIDALQDETVAVRENSLGNRELYNYRDGEWSRVFAENATIQVNESIWNYTVGGYGFGVDIFDAQPFEDRPTKETRQILRALNEEIFVDDLASHKNELTVLMFEYILTEQSAPEWLFKTSLIDVNHKVRELDTFPIYRQDNQDFVLDYLTEVKPYHTKIKNFSLRYSGSELYDGTVTDFDIPAYYDKEQGKFVTPQFTDPDQYNFLDENDGRWQQQPLNPWFNHHFLEIIRVDISNAGTGYTLPPVVDAVGGDPERPAVLTAKINTAGQVTAIIVEDPGYGYLSAPIIQISGGNGLGASAVAIVGNKQVRSIKTIMKFDRYEYKPSLVDWTPSATYKKGDLIRYLGNIYRAKVDTLSQGFGEAGFGEITFDYALFTEEGVNTDVLELVDQSVLSAADRFEAFYDPDSTDPGKELALLLAGIEYPGVQVKTPGFGDIEGFGSAAFDVVPYDHVIIGEDIPEYYYNTDYYGSYSFDEEYYTSEFVTVTISRAGQLPVAINNFKVLVFDSNPILIIGMPEDVVENILPTDVIRVEYNDGNTTQIYTQFGVLDQFGRFATDISVVMIPITENSVTTYVPYPDHFVMYDRAFAQEYNILDYATYDPALLDSILKSNFTDSYLGTDPAPAYDGEPVDTRSYAVTTHGGKFVDTFNSHAPEELVPGISFDTLDIRVYANDGIECNFGVFQDMLGNQKLYRILDSRTTMLVENLAATDDVIYVDDGDRLPEPNLDENRWGVIHINNERILYRYKNGNELSGLLRGVAGTSATDHEVGDLVEDRSASQLLFEPNQPKKNGIKVITPPLGPVPFDTEPFGTLPFGEVQPTAEFVTDIEFTRNVALEYLGKLEVLLTVSGQSYTLSNYEVISTNPLTVKINAPANINGSELVTIRYARPSAVRAAQALGQPVQYNEFAQLGIYLTDNVIVTPYDAEQGKSSLSSGSGFDVGGFGEGFMSDGDYTVLSVNPLTVMVDNPINVASQDLLYSEDDIFVISSEIDSQPLRYEDALMPNDIGNNFIFEVPSLKLPSEIRVKVGGTMLRTDQYTITNTAPTTVLLHEPVGGGIEVEIYVIQNETLYDHIPYWTPNAVYPIGTVVRVQEDLLPDGITHTDYIIVDNVPTSSLLEALTGDQVGFDSTAFDEFAMDHDAITGNPPKMAPYWNRLSVQTNDAARFIRGEINR